jgi:hypothetical protein
VLGLIVVAVVGFFVLRLVRRRVEGTAGSGGT